MKNISGNGAPGGIRTVNLGTRTDESIVLTGNYSELWIGLRMQARVKIMRELHASNYSYGFLVSMRADIGVAHAGAFCTLTACRWVGDDTPAS